MRYYIGTYANENSPQELEVLRSTSETAARRQFALRVAKAKNKGDKSVLIELLRDCPPRQIRRNRTITKESLALFDAQECDL